MIYTSYFSKYKGENGISIARTQPCKDGKPYYRELVDFRPPKWLFQEFKSGKITSKVFEYYYRNETLKSLDSSYWGNKLQGKVLLCWERTGQFCHRHIVANWLRKAGFEVKEWEESDGI